MRVCHIEFVVVLHGAACGQVDGVCLLSPSVAGAGIGSLVGSLVGSYVVCLVTDHHWSEQQLVRYYGGVFSLAWTEMLSGSLD